MLFWANKFAVLCCYAVAYSLYAYNCVVLGHDRLSEEINCKIAGNIRLVGSGLRHEGRLEVQYNGIWGTVSNNSFSSIEAQVFCYILGFG